MKRTTGTQDTDFALPDDRYIEADLEEDTAEVNKLTIRGYERRRVMMPNCSFKRCNRVARYLLTIEWRKHRYGEGICLCEKHLKKFPDLEYSITQDLMGPTDD